MIKFCTVKVITKFLNTPTSIDAYIIVVGAHVGILARTWMTFDVKIWCTYYSYILSLSLYYMYTRDNSVPIGLFRQFRLDFRTCFDVLVVRSEVQTQG